MRLEEVKTKNEFIDYTKQYGYHIEIYMFDYYGVRRLGDYTYEITLYKEKHKNNWCNDTETNKIHCSTQECFDIIRNEIRRQKLMKLKNKISI